MSLLSRLVRRARGRAIQVKSPQQLTAMRVAGLLVADALDAVRAEVRPGVSTAHLDAVAESVIRDGGGTPSFLGYHGFTGSICASVNAEVVHGIPRPDKILRDGDLLSVDCGAIVDGWHGDSAITVPVGEIEHAHAQLIEVAEDAMWCGIAAGAAGARLSDISHAIESSVEKWDRRHGREYGIVEQYGGHGIGTEMHQDPHILNYGTPGKGPRLEVGMALAIEPILTLGAAGTRELADGWTVVTADGSVAAHVEHTYAVTESGPWVLTARDGGRAELAARGLRISALGD
ncbi:type I methionyl aminopeptidase [Blastococcus sp. Marseille-P5729]|uniref:type I methionyl aminopeptidase n=1 Tax=Blastococcus sp. Marseille-P5729 TaxID=2086582 RepID=UPI001F3D36FD|nr:type I methionyl aminopeptidase [Blastococcus sp. Marseille-P5729]